MAYKTEDLYNKAIENIKEHGYHFVEDIICSLPCASPTFYEHFPTDSSKSKYLKELLHENRIAGKQKLRKKWEDSDNATLQISLYKLIGSDEERQKLSQSHLDIKHSGDKEQPIKLSIEQIDKILEGL